jgi:gliding motility-associated-like protein
VDENPASFIVNTSASELGYSEGDFLWQTNCSHVREQFYTVVFKAEDNNPETKLVDIKNVNIKVIGSAPDTPDLAPSSNSIALRWDPDPCPSVVGYKIYRREGPSGYTPDSCVSGVPSSTDYRVIATLNSRTETLFFDDNNGTGLEQGAEYCYLLVSVYPDGALSFPSEEVCSPLIAGTPALLEASVTDISTTGDVQLRWAQPENLDTIPANGPYEYIITRYSDLFARDAEAVYSKNTADIADTIFLDTEANTEVFPYAYTVVLYNDEPGNRFPISDTSQLEVASTMYPELIGRDNEIEISIKKNVPWINYDYTIYRHNELSGTFDSIGFTTDPVYVDKGLKNNQEYCYQVKSTGWRSINGKLYENENISHVNCTEPIDSIPPCTPILSGQSFCDEFYNLLTWEFRSDTCLEDVVGYRLYYTQTQNGTPTLIEEYESEASDTSYIDLKTEETLTGCYYISAVDSFANESPLSVQLCLDECSNYVLPNVFSPNNDRTNDLFIPLRTAYVERVDFQVFNKWGLLVFQTDDPDLNWDGKIQGSDKLVSPGVYYYICEVFEPRLGGIESYTLTGFIYVFSGNENEVFIEK